MTFRLNFAPAPCRQEFPAYMCTLQRVFAHCSFRSEHTHSAECTHTPLHTSQATLYKLVAMMTHKSGATEFLSIYDGHTRWGHVQSMCCNASHPVTLLFHDAPHAYVLHPMPRTCAWAEGAQSRRSAGKHWVDSPAKSRLLSMLI